METFFAVLVSTFVVITIAEFGDKTNLIALSLMSSSQRPFFIALMSTIGITLTSIFSVLLGFLVGSVLPFDLIRYVTAVIFIALGIMALFYTDEPSSSDQMEEFGNTPNQEDKFQTAEVKWYTPVYMVALAELGDKSQLFVISAAASTFPLAVFIGSSAGMGAIMFLTAGFGSLFFDKIDQDKLEKFAALLFIIAGLWIGISTLLA